MAENRSHEALKHVWVEWRKASGNKYKNDYLDFIDLNNEGAKELGKSSLCISFGKYRLMAMII